MRVQITYIISLCYLVTLDHAIDSVPHCAIALAASIMPSYTQLRLFFYRFDKSPTLFFSLQTKLIPAHTCSKFVSLSVYAHSCLSVCPTIYNYASSFICLPLTSLSLFVSFLFFFSIDKKHTYRCPDTHTSKHTQKIQTNTHYITPYREGGRVRRRM